MDDLFASLDELLTTRRQLPDERVVRHSRAYLCRCGNRIFFRNTQCIACASQLGYLPDEGRVVALDPGTIPDTWRADGRDDLLKFCANRADWASSFVSSYATSHPWEDWAETWAHYMHVVDSLGTAMGFGLDAAHIKCDIQAFTRDALHAADDPDAARLLELPNAWIEIVTFLNEMARSLGQPDFYPFVMCKPVVTKLHFMHTIVADARTRPQI